MRALATAVAAIASVLLASGCAGMHTKGTISVSVITTAGGLGLQQEVKVARASNRLFSIFPALPGKRHCVILDGALGSKPFRGTCLTSVRHRRTMEPSVRVTFTERWRRPACAPDLAVACAHPLARHTWQVIEGETIVTPGSKLRVLATRSSGAIAPQDYK